jgi:hypothetical protein
MVIQSYWYADYDVCLDFWNIMYDNDGIGYQVAACDDENTVKHITGMHNSWYQNEVFDTYVDNVTLTMINEIVREIAQDNPEDADYWQSQIMTDISQLPQAPHVLPF